MYEFNLHALPCLNRILKLRKGSLADYLLSAFRLSLLPSTIGLNRFEIKPVFKMRCKLLLLLSSLFKGNACNSVTLFDLRNVLMYIRCRRGGLFIRGFWIKMYSSGRSHSVSKTTIPTIEIISGVKVEKKCVETDKLLNLKEKPLTEFLVFSGRKLKKGILRWFQM